LAINQEYEQQVINALLEDDYEPISFMAVTSDDSLTTEIGSRNVVSLSVNNAGSLVYSSTRPASDVVDTVNGDIIEAIGMYADSTGGTVQISEDLPTLQQGLNFDLNVQFSVEFDGQ